MIYFSDLDRTIICSNKLLKENEEAICIEYVDNKETSYISNEIIENVKLLNSTKLFIPATTRSLEQFKRIQFNKFGINFKYSITSNGAHILKDGEILDSWKEEVKLLKSMATEMDILVDEYNNKFSELINPRIQKFKVVEDNFFYLVLNKDNKSDITFLNDFIKYIESNGWQYYKNCSKVYFLPKGITKENAIEFLIRTEFNNEKFNALGDSCMDAGMLSIANKAYIPKHGDISSSFKHSNLYVSEATGLEGIKEILDYIINN